MTRRSRFLAPAAIVAALFASQPSAASAQAACGLAPASVPACLPRDAQPIRAAVALPVTLTPAPTARDGVAPPGRAPEPTAPPFDQPIATAWPAVNTWNDAMEREYSAFVARLGRAVAERRCRRLDECLRDPTANTLFEPAVDARLNLDVDCADLPYILRAYFSYKRRLPFGFVGNVHGTARARSGPGARDPRYVLNVRPDTWRDWRNFRSPRDLLRQLGRQVHSGMYRTAPSVETADFYPAAINRRGVRPGSMFYDPNGHVLVVTELRPDGAVYFIDGHPDGSLTWKRFGQALVAGPARFGGGFKNFRPIALVNGALVRARNATLRDFDGAGQYDLARMTVAGAPATYHAWVRAQLADAGSRLDVVAEFREQVRALCRDVADRVVAVDFAISAGIHRQPHPASLPTNIYGTDGDWEIYSTPSRDARLKAAFRELRELAAGAPAQAAALAAAWREEGARAECQFAYTNSAGAQVRLTLDTVVDRLFALSFDPYHCPELRWGAPEGSAERATCADDADRLAWYRNEQRLRNRIDREYGVPTPLEFGPAQSPDVDPRRPIAAGVANAAQPRGPVALAANRPAGQ